MLEIEEKAQQAIEAFKSKRVKSIYAATKLVGLTQDVVRRCLNRGDQAHKSAQFLSAAEENALFS